MRLTLNYSVCTAIYLVPVFVIQTPLATVSQECIYCNWKAIISEGVFFKLKYFPLGITEISTLKSYTLLFSVKLSAGIRVSMFLLHSSSIAKIFQSFFAGNSFYFFNRFWNVWFSLSFYFTNSFLAWKIPPFMHKYK